MKTLRGRFIRTNIWMAALSAAWALVVLAGLLLAYLSWAQDDSRKLIGDVVALFSGESQEKDDFLLFILLWVILVALLVLATCIFLSTRLSRAVLRPLAELRQAADNIAKGELDFDVMSWEDQELEELCRSFEEIRKRLKANAEKELKAEEERSLLIANLSHDLRTPITTIKGYSEGLRDGVAASPEKTRQYLDTIYNKAVVLERLVESMTEFSELELGRLQYAMEYVDMTAYLKDLAEEYRPEAEERGFRFEARLPEEPLMVVADRGKLKRVLDNLVSNAMKYNKEGGSVLLSAETDGRGVLVCVSDTGTGIRREDLGRVFDVFYRGDEARSSSKGSGLGLAIARQIAEDHRGKIWMKSEDGSGAQVFLYLPLRDRRTDR
ncbi:MAG: HAMP domain-containing sensor histidine kinase [Bacillota bacterium]|nr:HAMP domain-containing sensor histidine kinase [Bacillota bacterium]